MSLLQAHSRHNVDAPIVPKIVVNVAGKSMGGVRRQICLLYTGSPSRFTPWIANEREKISVFKLI